MISLILFLLCFAAHPQLNRADLELLKNHKPGKTGTLINKEAEFVLPDSDNPMVQYNPFALAHASLVYAYQKVLSPQFSADCYYIPSCSSFSQDMVQEFGFFKGVFLTADRLMRCNRIAATGFHPVSIDPKTHKIHESPSMFKLKTDDHP